MRASEFKSESASKNTFKASEWGNFIKYKPELIGNANPVNAQGIWLNQCATLIEDYYKYYTSFKTKDGSEIQKLRKRTAELTKRADRLLAENKGNADMVAAIEGVKKQVTNAERDIKTQIDLANLKAKTEAEALLPKPNFAQLAFGSGNLPLSNAPGANLGPIKSMAEESASKPSDNKAQELTANKLKERDRIFALNYMRDKPNLVDFRKIISDEFADYDKRAQDYIKQQNEDRIHSALEKYNTAYRTAINKERANLGLLSLPVETMDYINQSLSENVIKPSDNGYTKTQKKNNLKYNNLLFGAVFSTDFKEKSNSGANISYQTLKSSGLREAHARINGQQQIKEGLTYAQLTDEGKQAWDLYLGKDTRIYTQLTESERQVWNYYIAKNATEQAWEFIQVLKPTLESRLAETVSEEYDEQGVAGDIKELVAAASGGLEKGINDILRSVSGAGESIGLHMSDELSYAFFSPTYTEKLTNEVLMDRNGTDSKVFNFILKAINTTTYQMPSYAIQAIGGGMAGYVLQGVGRTTTDAIRNNTESVADVIFGAYQGVAEWWIDKKLSGLGSQLAGGGTATWTKTILNKINNVVHSPVIKKWLSKAAIAGLTNVSENIEELIQMVSDPFARAIIYGEELDLSEITLENAIETIIITSLSTLMMSPLTTNRTYQQYIAENIGNNIIEMGGVESLVKFAEDFEANNTDLYDRVRTAFENKTEPDPMDVVSLYSAAMENYSTFSMDDAKKIAYNIADGGNVEGVARALFNGNTEAATKFIERFSGKQENTNSVKKTKVKRNQNNEYVPQFTENMDERSDFGIDNSVDNAVQNGYNNNRGDENVSFLRRTEGSDGQSAQINTRGEKTDGRNWREDEEAFTARNQGNTKETGRRGRVLLKLKNQRIAYTPSSTKDGHDGGQIATILGKCGIETVYVDGDIEIHENGITWLHSQGLTTSDGKVYISSNATASSIELAAHEAVHVNDVWQTDAYINYEAIIRENICWNSDEYSELANKINDGHYGGKYDIQDFSFSTKFVREVTAYVNQYVVANITKAERLFRDLFNDWDDVVDASRQFNKDIGADFSESAFSMDENGASQSGTKGISEPDISKDTRSHEERVAEMMGGKESQKVKGRKFVQSIGKALGVTVVFEDTVEKYGEWSDGYIDKNGVIHIDYNNKNPLAFLFRHEMVHYGSSSKFYKQFVNLVYKSKLFREWLQEKTKMPEGTSVDRMAAKYMTMVAESRKGVEKLSETRLQEEMVADFVGSDLFTAGGSGLAAMSTELDTKQRNVVSQYIADVISWLKKKINKVPGAENLTFELSRLEDTFNRMISDAKQNPTEREIKHSKPIKSVAKKGKSVYNEDTHYGEDLKNTQNNLKPTTDREWQVFCRSFANQTNGMKNGDKKVVSIFTADSHYLIDADGYMRGIIVSKSSIDDYNETEVFFDDASTEVFSYQNERNGHRQGNDSDYGHTFENKRTDSFDDELDAFIKRHPEWFGNKKQTYSYSVQRNGAKGKRGNQAELNDSAFSMPENIRRSVPIDSDIDTDTDTDTDNDIIADFQKLNNEFNKGNIEEEAYMQRVAELYEEIVKKNGKIKPGEVGKTKYQDIPVPKRIDKKTKVQRHVRTILEGGELTDEMVGTVKADILSGEFNYKPTSNKKNIAYAEDAVMKGAAVGIWERAINGDGLPTATDIAVGEALLKLAVERGNVAEVVKYTAELAELGTRLGQSVQALSTLKRMDGIGKLLYVKRAVDSLNRDLSKRFKGKAPVIQIDENMAMRLAESKTPEDFEITYSAIMNDIAAQVPATFLDKWNAWRYMAMLFNPTTHIRNVVGNAVFMPSIKIKNVLSVLGEKAFVKQENRTKSIKVKKEYAEFADNDFEKVVNAITGSGKMNPKTSIAQDKPIFKTKFLENLRKFNFDMLEKEDTIFLRKHYKNALGGYLQAQKVDLKNIPSETLARAREYAILEAQKATYRDANSIATAIQQFSNKNAATNVLIEGILPFKKTPMNIVKRGIEYSPIGIIKTLTKGVYDLKTGNITASQFIDGLAGGLTGTGIMLLGSLLSSLGIAVGGFDDDDEDWFRKLNGEQEYAIRIGDTSYTIDWAAPVCIPFFMGVAINEMARAESNENMLANMGELALAGLEPVINLSMLSGIQDTIAAARYADADEIIYRVAGNVVGSYFSQAVPTIGGKVANAFDDTRRSNYIDKSSNVPIWLQSAINTVKAKTPFLSQTRPEYINAWGEIQGNGNFIKRFFQQFLSPGYVSTVNENDISREISRLAKETGEAKVIPDNAPRYFKFKNTTRHLTAEEYKEYATVRGQKSADYIAEAISNSGYEELTDSQKVQVISDIYSYCNAYAKATLEYSYDEVNAMYDGKITSAKYSSLGASGKKDLVIEYFMDKYSKPYTTEKNGGSIVKYFIDKQKNEKKNSK